jgi:hypothetical protein
MVQIAKALIEEFGTVKSASVYQLFFHLAVIPALRKFRDRAALPPGSPGLTFPAWR